MHHIFLDHALLPHGWADNLRVSIDNGLIVAIEHKTARDGADHLPGIAIPGMPNLHCHTFQRGMAALAQVRGPLGDSFWTWRETMYRFLGQLTPDHVEAIAAHAYMEMLEQGFTAVGEFHYLHHDIDGRPYANIAEMAARIAAAAEQAGIGLTLLSSFYAYGGFGGAAPADGQRRFVNDPDQFLKLLSRSREVLKPVADSRVGIAPHSLRAVTPETLRLVVQSAATGPIHIHAAEQTKEVNDCVAFCGQRPVEWLLHNMPVNERWCLIHATHMIPIETRSLARSGAVAGLCPITEASLGDGIFDGARFLADGGRFGIGSDSNIQIDAAAEMRQLEYSQRLKDRARNVMTAEEGEAVGRRLFSDALAGGAQALSRSIGAIEVGRRADIVLLDKAHHDLAVVGPDHWLDAWIFTAARCVKDVMVGGRIVVRDGRHHLRDVIQSRYMRSLERLVAN